MNSNEEIHRVLSHYERVNSTMETLGVNPDLNKVIEEIRAFLDQVELASTMGLISIIQKLFMRDIPKAIYNSFTDSDWMEIDKHLLSSDGTHRVHAIKEYRALHFTSVRESSIKVDERIDFLRSIGLLRDEDTKNTRSLA